MKVEATLPDGRKATAVVNLEPGSFIQLEGPQGAGKSTILKALALAIGDNIGPVPEGASVEISTNDGDHSVTIRDKGGVKSKKFRFPTFSSEVFNKLVSSGAKNRDARCKDRVLAVYSLIDVTEESAPKLVKRIFPDKDFYTAILEGLRNGLGDRWAVSYLDFIKEVKKCAELLAREAEKKSADMTAVVSFWVDKLKTEGILEKVTAASIQRALDKYEQSSSFVNVPEKRRELELERASVEYAKQEVSKVLGQVGEYKWSSDDVEELVSQVKDVRTELIKIDGEINALELRKAAMTQKEHDLKEQGKQAVAYTEALDKIEASKGSDARVDAIDEQLKELDKEEKRRGVFQLLTDAKEQLGTSMGERANADSFSESARSLIKSGIVADLDLTSFGIDDIRVDEGDVCFVSPESGELVYMDKMSEGEQVKAAFDLMSRVTENKVIFPDRKLVSSLQPANFELVLKEIHERKLIALTEAPKDGEGITVSVYRRKV